jgi:hypothetical protein
MKRYLVLILLAFIGFTSYSQTSNDKDAQAFILACDADPAGKLTPDQKNYITQMVEGMKSIGVWSGMKAVYPLVGNTAFKNKFNLKDPRDLDVAFRLVFINVTHNNNGLTFSGAGSANTFFNSSTQLSVNSTIAQYTLNYVSGVENQVLFNSGGITQRFANTNFGTTTFFAQYKTNSYSATVPTGSAFKLSTTNSNGITAFFKGVKVIDNQSVSGTYPNSNFIIGAATSSSGGAFNLFSFFTGTISFQMLSNETLTDNQAQQLSHLIYYCQGILNRQ